jgi:hypothetical protein
MIKARMKKTAVHAPWPSACQPVRHSIDSKGVERTNIRELPAFALPCQATRGLWRYYDLAKFKSLLRDRALYFAAANQLTDHFEGSITRIDYERRLHAIARIGEMGGYAQRTISQAFEQLRRLTKISCWHLSKHESAAMWQLYIAEGKGVAIRTNIGRLKAALLPFYIPEGRDQETINLGRIKYLDCRRDKLRDSSMLARFFCKRRSFAYEREVRAVISLRQAEEFGVSIPAEGILVPVRLEKLLMRVHVAPGSVASFSREIADLVRAAGLNVPVLQSSLDDPAIY